MAKKNLELVELKEITLVYVYFLILKEWKLSKTKVEPHIFTANQFGSTPSALLNETACISRKSRNFIETGRQYKVFDSGLLSKKNIF